MYTYSILFTTLDDGRKHITSGLSYTESLKRKALLERHGDVKARITRLRYTIDTQVSWNGHQAKILNRRQDGGVEITTGRDFEGFLVRDRELCYVDRFVKLP